MIRWQHLLNKLSTDDPVLQDKLSRWQDSPHLTPLALIQGFSFISAIAPLSITLAPNTMP